MKRTERHKLKENEFAKTVAQAREALEKRKRDITVFTLIIVALLAAVGGWIWWRGTQEARATALLASALAVHEAPVVPLPEAAPGSPLPVQQPGTFPTDQARLDAALPRFLEAAEAYPNTGAAVAARYAAASILARLGRVAEAEQHYQAVAESGRGIYARTARLGVADAQLAQGQYDNAIAIYTELSRDPNAQIPVDAVLMQLGRAYARAGRSEEAASAFNRVISEFPQSLYAADARREMEAVRKG